MLQSFQTVEGLVSVHRSMGIGGSADLTGGQRSGRGVAVQGSGGNLAEG
jgi:hypothetical protein